MATATATYLGTFKSSTSGAAVTALGTIAYTGASGAAVVLLPGTNSQEYAIVSLAGGDLQ